VKYFILLIFLVLSVTPSYGRLGETQEECSRRYGAPTEQWSKDNTGPGATYLNKNIRVDVFYMPNGQGVLIANYLSYKKRKAENSGFNSQEIDKLLENNAQGSSWEQRDTTKTALSEKDELKREELMRSALRYIIWDRADGKVMADYDKEEGIFTVGTWVFIDSPPLKEKPAQLE
jgi:hypothetical protein